MKRFLVVISLVSALLLFVTAYAPVVAAAENDGYSWVGAWSTSPVETVVEADEVKLADFLFGQTVRVMLQPTLDGERVRIKISNKFGKSPLIISNINLARASSDTGSGILTDTIVPLTVGRRETATIPAGEERYSDAVNMNVSALEYLAISYYAASYTEMRTGGLVGANTYTCLGNQTASAQLSGAALLSFDVSGNRLGVIPFITGMDVYAKDAYSIVIIGDSTVCNDIPDILAEKFVASGVRNIGILQQAIKGNRLLYDGVGFIGNLYGEAMAKRFASDALTQTGVKKIFVKIGINDVLHPRTVSMKDKAPFSSAEEIIAGYETLVEKAHRLGIEIYFFTMTPWKGYTREILQSDTPDLVWSEEAEDMCVQLNDWILNNTAADGCVDLSSLRSEEDPAAMREGFTDDGIHFTRDGQVAVVDAIPVSYFGLLDKQIKSYRELIAERIGANNEDESTTNTNNEEASESVIAPVTNSASSSENTVNNTLEPTEQNTQSVTEGMSQENPVTQLTEAEAPPSGVIEITPFSTERFRISTSTGLIIMSVLSLFEVCVFAIGIALLIYKKKERKLRKN